MTSTALTPSPAYSGRLCCVRLVPFTPAPDGRPRRFVRATCVLPAEIPSVPSRTDEAPHV